MTFIEKHTIIAAIAIISIHVLNGCQSSNLYQYNHYMKVKNYEAAKETMYKETEENPYNPEFHLLLGEAHLKLREYKEARASFNNSRYTSSEYIDRIQKLMASHYQQEFNGGVRAIRNEKYDLALSYFYKALEIEPNRHEVYPVLGFSYFKLQQYENAYESYLQATQLEENDAPSFHALAELSFRKGGYAQAVDYARRATNIDNGIFPAFEILVYANIELEEYSQAEQAYHSIPESERSFTLTRNYTFELFNQGRYDSLRPHLEKIVEQHPDDGRLLRTLAETYRNLGNFEGMAETYEVLWENNPENQDLLTNLIAAYDMMGNQEKADKYKQYIHDDNDDG